MLKKVNISIILLILTTSNSFSKVSQKDLINGVFFGTGPVASKVDYIKNNYSLKKKLSYSKFNEAKLISDKLSSKIIKKHPHFTAEFTKAVNEGNLIDVLHHIEQADTILTSLYDNQDSYNPQSIGVAVVAVAVVAVTVHNVVAITSVAAAAVAVTVKVALKTANDEDSLMHREKLSMELIRSFKR